MGVGVFVGNDYHRWNLLLSQSDSIPPQARSRLFHDLMDRAALTKNNTLWLRVGRALVSACDRDDLSSQVSDHFVDGSPDEVFVEVANGSPRRRFRRWDSRAGRLGV